MLPANSHVIRPATLDDAIAPRRLAAAGSNLRTDAAAHDPSWCDCRNTLVEP
jgi:hypothetical protein